MTEQPQWQLRLSLLSELIRQAPGSLGRTALMKLAYLLQTIKELPLGYDFRLYTYGPFDSDLLNDLGQAQSLGLVQSRIVQFPAGSGYGYEFSAGPGLERASERIRPTIAAFQSAIHWVLDEFGRLSAADLELITTIIYADREAARDKEEIAVEDLGRTVKEVKPRFADCYILEKIEELAKNGLLTATKA